MDAVLRTRRGVLRVAVVALLALAGLLVALPWLTCSFVPGFWVFDMNLVRACTLGDPAMRGGYGLPGFAGPFWGNVIVGIVYLAAATFAAATRRPL